MVPPTLTIRIMNPRMPPLLDELQRCTNPGSYSGFMIITASSFRGTLLFTLTPISFAPGSLSFVRYDAKLTSIIDSFVNAFQTQSLVYSSIPHSQAVRCLDVCRVSFFIPTCFHIRFCLAVPTCLEGFFNDCDYPYLAISGL